MKMDRKNSPDCDDGEHPRQLIPSLCKQFYDLGWMTGTGGSMSIKLNDEIYITPSGLQKERIKQQPEDLFVQNIHNEDISSPPAAKKLKKSQCTPLLINVHSLRGESYRFDDELAVPIIENAETKKDLKGVMTSAMNDYPDTCAVLVRRHGVYVWGKTWQSAKTMCECYDYLFGIALQMKMAGLDCTKSPNR